jgi:tetratricopeptide (TPR) repeat protein
LEPVRTDTAPLSGVCRLVGLATDAPGEAFRFASLSPFVGRRIEVSRLLELLAETESGHGQTVGITGEPGMGKSRLLYELRARQEVAAARWIEGRALSYAGNIPYFVVGRLIASACGLRTGDDPMVAERRVAQTVERAGGPPEWTAILLRVLNRRAEEAGAGLDPAARKTRIIDVIRRFLWRLARQRTLVIAVEDLHWSDPTSEEVLAALAESIVDAHVLLVCTHRPGYRPPWAARSYSSQLTLRPLGAVDGRAVMQSAAGTDLDDALAHQILSRADGNPFFVEELTRVVVEGGGVTVPETLTGVLAAAIAALDDEPRRLLQAASVLGRSFPSRLLPLISSGSTPYDAVAAELRRRELLYESDAGDEAHHVFRHVLTQEVAYSSLSSQARRELHSAAAAAFEQCWSDRLEQVEHELARHHARSGDPARAVHWLTRVARTAAAQYAHHEALSALEEAAAHAANLPARERSRVRVELLLAQANSLFLLGLLPEVVARFTADQQSLDELDDPALTGPWHFVLAHAHCLLGHRRETATHAAIAIRAATLADDRDTLGKTHYVLGVDGMWSSQLQAGAEHGRTAVALLDTSPELYWRGMSHWVTAINLGMGGHFPAALEGVERCHADAEACGDPRVMAYATWTHAFVLMFIGQEQRAVDQARRAVERARDPYTHHACRCVLGWVYLTAGDASRAVQELEAGTSWMVGAAFERAAALFGSAFAAALLAAGEDARAVVLATRCLDIMNRTGCGYAAGLAQRTLARAARRRGDPSAAAMLSETAQTFAAIDSIFEEAVTREELAEMALAEGDETAAQDEFRRAVGLLEGTGALCHLERVRTRLQSLRSD